MERKALTAPRTPYVEKILQIIATDQPGPLCAVC
jgi:hypothetical protein